MTLNRRTFLTGALAALAAPAVIRTPGLLMPVRRWNLTPVADELERRLNAGMSVAGHWDIERSLMLGESYTNWDLKDAVVTAGQQFSGKALLTAKPGAEYIQLSNGSFFFDERLDAAIDFTQTQNSVIGYVTVNGLDSV